jgi:EAL domain-containing protein (putative c-di-GMP-specific phosphodiesterase class I)
VVQESDSEPAARPYLDWKGADSEGFERVVVTTTPFRIGRGSAADLVVYSREISKLHAEIVEVGDEYVVRDLGSRNGTFVNGDAIDGDRVLHDGDVLHLATKELRFGLIDDLEATDSTLLSDPDMHVVVRGVRFLTEILEDRGVRAVFQGVVSMTTREVVGYEALSRITVPDADFHLGELFNLAARQSSGDRLSRLMREVALEAVGRLPAAGARVFFNVHPAELDSDELFESLAAIPPALAPGSRGIIEFPETMVTDLRAVESFRSRLRELDLGLAYDDFGAGQSRLMELAEVPPDIIKLDMSLIHDIHLSTARQELVSALIKVMKDLNVEVLAEGIETEEEWQVCERLGCDLAQGFLTHRPASVDDILGDT